MVTLICYQIHTYMHMMYSIIRSLIISNSIIRIFLQMQNIHENTTHSGQIQCSTYDNDSPIRQIQFLANICSYTVYGDNVVCCSQQQKNTYTDCSTYISTVCLHDVRSCPTTTYHTLTHCNIRSIQISYICLYNVLMYITTKNCIHNL